ncbi:MAG TPA: endonuclease MutS2 [Syntrophothermus lipocalidus]|nr:endonuclease MutS2 [Syntrophothermus lipocalidus]
MEEKALHRLEFDKILEMLSQKACSPMGAEKALELQPVYDLETASMRQQETGEALKVLRLRDTGFLTGVKDIRQHMRRVRSGVPLSTGELLDVGALVRASRLARDMVEGRECPGLCGLTGDLFVDEGIERAIRESIDEGGEVRDTASPELKAIRNRIATAKNRVREYLQEFVRSSHYQKFLQDAIITERQGRYVVPVKAEYRSEVKGIIHDESASGATVFVEPEAVVHVNNDIRRLEMAENREIEKILRRLTSLLEPVVSELERDLEILTDLDLVLAKGRLALEMNAVAPRLNGQGVFVLRRARHPLLGKGAVPVDLELGKGFDILVITGPNTGGKTVTLKTVGLLTLMAMSGLFVPAAEGTEIALVDAVYADIGDEQSIEQSLSTFSSHMTNIIDILKRATSQSLVLLDELGAGTDPVEGAALGRAILGELLAKGVKAVVTTHQSELKVFAFQEAKVENACVEFDPITLQPTYRLSIGIPGHSNALEIAERLGLDHRIVEKARQFVPQSEQDLGRIINKVQEHRRRLESDIYEVEELRRRMEEERRALQEEKEKLRREREEIIRKTREEAESYLRKVKGEADTVLDEVKRSLKERETPPKWHELEKARHRVRGLRTERQVGSLQAPEGAELNPGAYVEIRSIGRRGYILEGPNDKNEVVVQVGILKLTVPRDDVVLTTPPEEEMARRKSHAFLEKAKRISPELDLRGLTADDAVFEVERYIEDAYLAGLEKVRIIHGKGTGALRQAVREWLAQCPRVTSFRDGEREEGGHGVTVAFFRK